MVSEEPKQSPQNPKRQFPKESENGEKGESMFSPRFKSVAAMAGWDEETLLIASLIVEDTPDRDFKHKKRSNSQFKSPPTTNSRRKRRAQKRSPISMSVPVLNLDEEQQISREEREEEKKKTESKTNANEEKRRELAGESSGVSCSSSSLECIDRLGEEKTLREECEKKKTESKTNDKKMGEESSSLPCMNRLREELSCAICLDICFEPSTTPCGHSFCKKCLRSAADKCGKRCPKCRQLISNGRSCTVNTVLWNTIQLLFPQEVEARKAITATLNNREAEPKSTGRVSYYNARNRSVQALNSPEAEPQNSHDLRNRRVQPLGIPSRGNVSVRRRRGVPSQDEDAALALRLQREEFMEAFRGSDEQYSRSSSFSSARENLRAMATRAMNTRIRNRPT